MPMNFVSLDEFHCRRFWLGEAISLYVHELRKFLTHALPDLEQAPRVIIATSVFGGNSRGHLQTVKSFGRGNYFKCSDHMSKIVDDN